MKRRRMTRGGRGWGSAAIVVLLALTACGLPRQPANNEAGEWVLQSTKRFVANELWKEHNGAAGLYIDRGCISETMSDYRHRSRPWTLRCSVFDQTTPEGARSLFDYYRNGIDSEDRNLETIGEATYLWKSSEARSWIVGFCRGKYFVEASLAVEGGGEAGLSEDARRALLRFARNLANAF